MTFIFFQAISFLLLRKKIFAEARLLCILPTYHKDSISLFESKCLEKMAGKKVSAKMMRKY